MKGSEQNARNQKGREKRAKVATDRKWLREAASETTAIDAVQFSHEVINFFFSTVH